MEASNVKAMRKALKEIHQMGIDLRNIIPHLDKRWEVHLKAAINIYQTAERAYLSPPRNCDKVKDHSDAIGKFEKWMGFSPKTADEQDAFFKEHWFEFAMWLIDMKESEATDGEK